MTMPTVFVYFNTRNDNDSATLTAVLGRLSALFNSDKFTTITVRRSNVLNDAMRALGRPKFSIHNIIKVTLECIK